MNHRFQLIKEKEIKELETLARLYIHKKTGARLLSLSNNDENKVFGIIFRTPPSDSTGVPHILEHSVLCGSRKYPVKEPFVELLKGSMSTFLNAFTYPDKTCYPVASQNVKDFYNLIDVYLDAVFFPKLSRYTFMQEGWHYELASLDSALTINGIVYSEMKGVYSSADIMLDEYSLRSLFPDTIYKYDSGGDPKEIPNLTYEDFLRFHRRFYHPSNSFIWFYGDDNPEQRLIFIDEYLKEFEKKDIESAIPSQPILNEHRKITKPFMAESSSSKGMITVNWLFPDLHDQKLRLSFMILEHILIGMPGSPLRKALIESGLGEDIAGVGLEREIRHMFFSTGLKGVDVNNMPKVEELIFEVLNQLVKDGIDKDTIDAAINTIEFRLRENNTGRFPRGLSLMLRALTFWIYEADPISVLMFDKQLTQIKEELSSKDFSFEQMIKTYFLENLHRTTVMLKPDPELKKREEMEERKRLDEIKSKMSVSELKKIIQDVQELRKIQQTPDSPSALAKIPVLDLKYVDRENKKIPSQLLKKEPQLLFHDISTNGIFYIDVGFNLKGIEQKYIPYVPLIAKALIEIGTKKQDYVKIGQRIGQHTGGIRRHILVDQVREEDDSCFWLFLRGKSLISKVSELMDIMRELILDVNLNNKDRFLQLILEEKARFEKNLLPSGHDIVARRICAGLSESGWLEEKTKGISYLFFLRRLSELIKSNWDQVYSDIIRVYEWIINRKNMLINITCPQNEFERHEKEIDEFIYAIPASERKSFEWKRDLTIARPESLLIKAKVNFVGKGASLYHLGYKFHGSSLVITRYLRNTWLWDSIRVQGGAYGAHCIFDRLSGDLVFVSYRDPNIKRTIESYDKSSDFLKNIELSKRELTKAVIRTIADIDAPLLPDAKGFRSMRYYLTKDTEDARQRMREEVLETQVRHFREFSDVLFQVKEKGIIKVMGPEENIAELKKEIKELNIMEVMK